MTKFSVDKSASTPIKLPPTKKYFLAGIVPDKLTLPESKLAPPHSNKKPAKSTALSPLLYNSTHSLPESVPVGSYITSLITTAALMFCADKKTPKKISAKTNQPTL